MAAKKKQRPRKDPGWLARAEVNALALAGGLPDRLHGARIRDDDAVPIHDLNGEVLFHRVPLVTRGEGRDGYVDIAEHPAMGEALVAVAESDWWDPDRLRKDGLEAAKEMGIKAAGGAETRFVVFSFPKLALQLLRDGEEVALLELVTWEPVPPSTRERNYRPPSDFERWSYLDELPQDHRERRERRYRERLDRWREREVEERVRELEVIDRERFADLIDYDPGRTVALWRTRELHYSTRNTDHEVCYELRGQETSVWCVAASVQMLLDFYRYEYTQVRLAQELGLGTLTNPNGLPYSRDADVVTVIEALSCSALNAAMNTSPTFSEFVSEIDANRPLISFVPGHSRTVAGYYRSFIALLGQPPFRGLLVYDPWPPNTGVITRWENYGVTTYRRTFTARPCTA